MLNIQQSSSPSFRQLARDQLLVRINGTLAGMETLGNVERSERAAEVKQYGMNTNTSCSFFALPKENINQIFHMGNGIVESLQKGISDLGFNSSSSYSLAAIPDAVLMTHSHEDHTRELSLLVDKAIGKSKDLKVYCTSDCRDQILDKHPQLSSMIKNNQISFTVMQPGENFDVGPFSLIPILSHHGENSPTGSVIYIVKLANLKVLVVGWNFLSLPNIDENLLWNPDLAILGTQSFNPHPQTGMMSVSEAFELIRRSNAKECYLVHYRGLLDFEEASNQWFMVAK
jgi:L-ascorbate metabolism protein UlaG (beta-lactamase superfamily)